MWTSALLLAQNNAANAPEIPPGVAAIFMVIYFAILLLMIVSLWKVFEKAGKPGWAAIIPIYNIIVMLQIVGKPVWWVLLLFIPFVGIVVSIMMVLELAKKFGKGGGFALGLILLPIVFYPILAFGDAKYEGSTSEYDDE
ncbi:MAG: DUF5684 domain-containing protein [Planctomycetaceae bacterium]